MHSRVTGPGSYALMTLVALMGAADRVCLRFLVLSPGQAGQIMSVNDDVVESDGHVGSMRGTLDRIGNPLFCRGRVDHRRSRHAIAPRSCDQPDLAAAREPSQLSTWPDGKIITESNRALRTCAKYPPFGARAASDWGVPRTVQSWGICVGTRPGCEWHGGVSWAAWAVLGLQPCALDERPKIARAAGLRASRAVVCSDPAIPPARLAELVTRAEGSNREISPVTAPTAAALAART
jgi:hypothetical protein